MYSKDDRLAQVDVSVVFVLVAPLSVDIGLLLVANTVVARMVL